jgi:hypothetical protein
MVALRLVLAVLGRAARPAGGFELFAQGGQRYSIQRQPAWNWPALYLKTTQLTYNKIMQATFVELPPFERTRKDYMDDDAYSNLQQELMANPEAGDVMEGTGGLRKIRQPDPRRGKGKRGGLRVIYYWWLGGDQFWLFTVFDKDQADDLTPEQRKALKQMLKRELDQRQPQERKAP